MGTGSASYRRRIKPGDVASDVFKSPDDVHGCDSISKQDGLRFADHTLAISLLNGLRSNGYRRSG